MNDAFLHLLKKSTKKRIPLEKIRLHWVDTHPEHLYHPNRDALIMAELTYLAGKGEISLPAPQSFDHRGQPPMPKFITLATRDKENQSDDYKTTSWMPELHFWPQLNKSELATLKPINDWLISRKGQFTPVPLRERSLELFGDEKYLDLRIRDNALFSGKLPLQTIGAFLVPHPLPYRAATHGKPLLVVENHHTYWSLAEWNTKAKQYAAVVYGSGNTFPSSQQALTQIQEQCQTKRALYFGDIDPAGVIIPLSFNNAGSNRVQPAIDLYRFILAKGKKTLGVNRKPQDEQYLKEWLPELSDPILDIWSKGYRIPQENLGTEQLLNNFSTNTSPAIRSNTRQT